MGIKSNEKHNLKKTNHMDRKRFLQLSGLLLPLPFIGCGTKPEAEAPKEKTEKPRSRKLKFTYNEEKEYAVIDEEIEALEEKVRELDLEIVRNATDYPKLSALTKEKEETEEKLMEKMERWEYLTDLAERIEQERGK